MVTLRLQRIGRSKEPHFRLIAQDKRKDQWDKSIEILGWLNPRTKAKDLKKDRIEYWLSVGAQPSDTVNNLLINEGMLKGDKRRIVKVSKKRKEKLSGGKKEETAIPAAKEEKKGEVKKEEPKKESKPVEKPAEPKPEPAPTDKKE